MVIKRETSNTRSKTSLRIWLLAGASSVALAAVVVTLTTRTVQADTPLPRPTATAPATAPVASATPTLLAPQASAREKRSELFHGIASWYGSLFNGRRTASGEIFNKNALTACHPTLPFGTLVRVVNLKNKKSVVVRITDRGDLVEEKRVIDLSFAAAEKLAMLEDGLAPVIMEVISLGRSGQRN
jgi:rare lipoprotein A